MGEPKGTNGDGVSGFFLLAKKPLTPSPLVPFGPPFPLNEKKLSIKVLTSNEN